jgi:hypothetical protein
MTSTFPSAIIKSNKMIWVGHATHMGEIRNAYTILFRKSQGMKQVSTSTNEWEILKQILE